MREVIFIIIFASFFLMPSCSQDDNAWQKKCVVRIDTLTRNKIVSIADSLDSLCLDQYESLFSFYVDSIKAVRRKEIEDLISND